MDVVTVTGVEELGRQSPRGFSTRRSETGREETGS